MREPLQLAKLATGDCEFSDLTERALDNAEVFCCYNVHLPVKRFRGIPTEWVFLVMDGGKSKGRSDNDVRQEARDHLRRIAPDPRHATPILIISDVPGYGMASEFGAEAGNIFCLDHGNIPNRAELRPAPRHTPLATAIGRKLESSSDIVLKLCPYLREKPVSGWRFFGREAELRQLLNTDESYMVVGPRRIGKTSLMLEAKRILEEKPESEAVYYVNVQEMSSSSEVINALASELSPSDKARAVRRKAAMDESLLSVVLRHLSNQPRRVTLFLDEIGNVIERMSPDDWKFFGTLRKHVQRGDIRLVMSAFQELYLRQQEGLGGPLVNFAHTMRIGVFSEREVEQFVIAPWEFWKPMAERTKQRLLEDVLVRVGRHPLFLQYFGYALFDQLCGTHTDLLAAAQLVLNKDLPESFQSAVDEVFYHSGRSAALKYLFLKRASEWWETVRKQPQLPVIDADWIRSTLAAAGFTTTTAGTRNLLEGLELYGFTAPDGVNRGMQRIVVPVVWHFVSRMEKIPEYLEGLGRDIAGEATKWNLQKV